MSKLASQFDRTNLTGDDLTGDDLTGDYLTGGYLTGHEHARAHQEEW